jgi:hypothetical protein
LVGREFEVDAFEVTDADFVCGEVDSRVGYCNRLTN